MLAETLGWTQMILFSFITLPQIFKTIRTGIIDGVSISVYFILVIANIIALWYAILIGERPLIAKYIIGIIVGAIYLLVYYHHKGKINATNRSK